MIRVNRVVSRSDSTGMIAFCGRAVRRVRDKPCLSQAGVVGDDVPRALRDRATGTGFLEDLCVGQVRYVHSRILSCVQPNDPLPDPAWRDDRQRVIYLL